MLLEHTSARGKRSLRLAAVIVWSLLCPMSMTFPQVSLRDAFPHLSFSFPVGVYDPGDGSNRLFVLEQYGIIRVMQNDSSALDSKVFLDISDSVVAGGELGLLGLAFHPKFASNGYFYVDYTAGNPLRTVISRFQVSPLNPDSAARSGETVMIEQLQPFSNHNGGQLMFGPDGYLYIGFGDGGSGGDPLGNAQNDSTLLGKILRIDVDSAADGRNYSIPADNPYADNTTGYRREIYAKGVRNPWRFSFDQTTRRLWVADVGQNAWEEIDTVVSGHNYGWNIMEGSHCYLTPPDCDQTGLSLPVWEYGHDSGRCSITGGFMYRGWRTAPLYGKYLYADACTGEVWALSFEQPDSVANTKILATGKEIVSFGADQAGELYACSYSEGKIYKFISSVPPEPPEPLQPADHATGMPAVVTLRWSASSGAIAYHLQLFSDSSLSLLAADDTTNQDTSEEIGPLSPLTMYYWRVRALGDGGPSPFSALRTFTTAAYSFTYHVTQGWNLISLPLDISDGRTSVLFPSAITGAFAYDPVSGYKEADTLLPGAGYWLKFAASETPGIGGSVRPLDTLRVVDGWNLIGTLSDSVATDAVIQEPAGILTSDFFQYLGTYVKASVLKPGNGYWVKAHGSGRLILEAPSGKGASSPRDAHR